MTFHVTAEMPFPAQNKLGYSLQATPFHISTQETMSHFPMRLYNLCSISVAAWQEIIIGAIPFKVFQVLTHNAF